MHLAQVHQLTRDILQGSFAWNKLISRTCLQDRGALQRKMEVVRHLVDILKLMKNRKANMLDLLDTICKRSPPEAVEGASDTVTLTCPNHPNFHQVRFRNFLLLEAVEGAFGTSEQKAISATGFFQLREPAMSTLSSRLARQQEKLTRLWFLFLRVSRKESAEAFKTLMEASSEVTTGGGIVLGAIGGEGWKALAEGVRLHPLRLRPAYVTVLKDDLDEASKEDIRVIWDALETYGFGSFRVVDPSQEDGQTVRKEEDFPGEGDDGGWTKLTEMMETSKEEWIAQVEADLALDLALFGDDDAAREAAEEKLISGKV